MSVLKVKRLDQKAIIPTKAHSTDACYDLYTCGDQIVECGRTIVKTGIAIALPDGCVADVRPRSGYSAKGMEGVSVANGKTRRYNADVVLGTIDESYRGEVGIMVHNHCAAAFTIPPGTRLAQLLVHRVETTQLVEAETLDTTDRGADGFGSTN